MTSDDLSVTISGGGDPDGDPVSNSIVWLQNGVVTAYSSAILPSTATTAGELWTVQVTPNDGITDGPMVEASVSVLNSPPSVSAVSISPGSGVYNDSVLSCSATVSDLDQSISATYSWSVDGSTYSGATLDLSTTTAMPGDSVSCTASAIDSMGATASAQAQVSVENRNPVLTAPQLSLTQIPSTAEVSCSATATDADGDTPIQSIEWSLNGQSLGTANPISLTPIIAAVGDVLTCMVTATDVAGGSSSASVSGQVVNTAPTLDSLTLSPTQPSKTDTLVCSVTSTDADGHSISASFAWSNQSTGATYVSSSSTASTASLDLSALAVNPGEFVECSVSIQDGYGGSDSGQLAIEVVNSAPVFTQAAVITPASGVVVGSALSCTATVEDPNDGVLTSSYTWTVAGTPVSYTAAYVVDSADVAVGDSILCIAEAVDSDDGERQLSGLGDGGEHRAGAVGCSDQPCQWRLQ